MKKASKDSKELQIQRAFIRAAGRGDIPRMEKLLEQGALINGTVKENKWTSVSALHLAAEKSQINAMKFLIKRGADVDFCNEAVFYPPLMVASGLEAVKLLVRNGADVNSGDWNEMESVLGSHKREMKILRYLVSKGADLETRTGAGYTVLGYSIFLYENSNVVSNLLELGASTNVVNDQRQSALDVAYWRLIDDAMNRCGARRWKAIHETLKVINLLATWKPRKMRRKKRLRADSHV